MLSRLCPWGKTGARLVLPFGGLQEAEGPSLERELIGECGVVVNDKIQPPCEQACEVTNERPSHLRDARHYIKGQI